MKYAPVPWLREEAHNAEVVSSKHGRTFHLIHYKIEFFCLKINNRSSFTCKNDNFGVRLPSRLGQQQIFNYFYV